MQDLNKYGFYSGGYIADLLDRRALEAVNDNYPSTVHKQLYTSHCEIRFLKQLCTKKCTPVLRWVIPRCGVDRRREYVVNIELFDANWVQVAGAEFTFKIAKRNYCEIGGKDGAIKTV